MMSLESAINNHNLTNENNIIQMLITATLNYINGLMEGLMETPSK